MPLKRYTDTITDQEVLALFASRKYIVDTTTGVVADRRGVPLHVTYGGRENGRAFKKQYHYVRLYYENYKRRALPVAQIVWMVATNSTPPEGFEFHHRDENPSNNAFSNILCLHPLDHDKFHPNRYFNSDPPF